MADDAKKTETAAKAEGNVVEQPAGSDAQQQQIKITLDDKSVDAADSNFCRVTGTPEEVIVDFSLNPNPYSQQDQTVKVARRIVLNHFTAKRLFAALQQTIMRHEQNFGVIELNVRRRLSSGAPGAESK